MEKIVIDSKIKLITDDIEDVIDKEQYVSEVAETSSIVTTKISPEQTYNFENPSGKGIKVLKIVSICLTCITHRYRLVAYNLYYFYSFT